MNQEQIKQDIAKLDDELNLYEELLKVINSCTNIGHCDVTRNMLNNLAKNKPNLAAALIYPLRIKRRQFHEESELHNT